MRGSNLVGDEPAQIHWSGDNPKICFQCGNWVKYDLFGQLSFNSNSFTYTYSAGRVWLDQLLRNSWHSLSIGHARTGKGCTGSMRRLSSLTAGITLVVCSCTPGHGQRFVSADYMAAFVGPVGLTVFPFVSQARTRSFNADIKGLAYSPDGDFLYGQAESSNPQWSGIVRLNLESFQIERIPGTEAFRFRRSDQSVSEIVLSPNQRCDYLTDWHCLSVSPDMRYIAASKLGAIVVIDSVSGAKSPLGRGWKAAWSPDGKWIAMTQGENNLEVTLIDSHDWSSRRSLGATDDTGLVWSPDSQYLLIWKSGLLSCGPYFGTLATINVESGKRENIQSSSCKVNVMTAGWVSNLGRSD
jgi:hypothetical protein